MFMFFQFQAKYEQNQAKKSQPLLPTDEKSLRNNLDSLLLKNNNMLSSNHIVFQGDKAFSSMNGDARTPGMYKTYDQYRIV